MDYESRKEYGSINSRASFNSSKNELKNSLVTLDNDIITINADQRVQSINFGTLQPRSSGKNSLDQYGLTANKLTQFRLEERNPDTLMQPREYEGNEAPPPRLDTHAFEKIKGNG